MLTPANICSLDSTIADSPSRSSTVRRRCAWMLVAVWSVVVATGMGLLAAYANSAGKSALAPASIDLSNDTTSARYQLFMFVHPRCPCSVASVNELARIMSRCSAQIDATVYFERPDSEANDWERGSLWNLASSIPGVHVKSDTGGGVAEQFHANTSGEVVVYDRGGKLRFQGGITASRGHAGDNLGESTVISIALGEISNVERSPVFGCPFRAEAANSGK
jgi:hypothetical protein